MSILARTISTAAAVVLCACSNGESSNTNADGSTDAASGTSGGGISGIYASDEFKIKYEFTPERVYITSLVGTSATTYTTDGNRVLVGIEGGQQVLTQLDDGSLEGPMGMILTKERADIKPADNESLAANAGSGSPAAAAEAYLSAMAAYDFETAFANVNGGDEMMAMPAEQLAAITADMRAGLEAQGGIQEFRVTDEQIDGEAATVMVDTLFGNGDEQTATMQFIKNDGRWLLD
jgi:hypothetical protein